MSHPNFPTTFVMAGAASSPAPQAQPAPNGVIPASEGAPATGISLASIPSAAPAQGTNTTVQPAATDLSQFVVPAPNTAPPSTPTNGVQNGFVNAPAAPVTTLAQPVQQFPTQFAAPQAPAAQTMPSLGAQGPLPAPPAQDAPAVQIPQQDGAFPVVSPQTWDQRTEVYLADGTLTKIPGEPVFPMPDVTLDRKGEVPRDNRGQYKLPDVNDPTRVRSYVRATTSADATATDKKGLERWKDETLLKGLALYPDLLRDIDVSKIGTNSERYLREVLYSVSERARVAVGGADGRLFGDSVHAWTEALDKGLIGLSQVPAVVRRHAAVYLNTLVVHGIKPIPEYVERVVYCPHTDSVGTLDRIYMLPDGQLVIGDVKTSSNISFGWPKIAAQLAQYGYASHMYDEESKSWIPMVAVNQDVAVVAHVPANPPDNRDVFCDLGYSNIKAGLELVRIAATLARMNQKDERARFLVRTLGTSATSDQAMEAMLAMYPAVELDQNMVGAVPEQVQQGLGLPEDAVRGPAQGPAITPTGEVIPTEVPSIPGVEEIDLADAAEVATSPRHGEALAALRAILSRRPRAQSGLDGVSNDLFNLYNEYQDVWTPSMTERGVAFQQKLIAKITGNTAGS